MTNVKGEHFKFDKVKPMLQNELFNIECSTKKNKRRKLLPLSVPRKQHTQLSLLFFKEDNVSNDLLGFSKTHILACKATSNIFTWQKPIVNPFPSKGFPIDE